MKIVIPEDRQDRDKNCVVVRRGPRLRDQQEEPRLPARLNPRRGQPRFAGGGGHALRISGAPPAGVSVSRSRRRCCPRPRAQQPPMAARQATTPIPARRDTHAVAGLPGSASPARAHPRPRSTTARYSPAGSICSVPVALPIRRLPCHGIPALPLRHRRPAEPRHHRGRQNHPFHGHPPAAHHRRRRSAE